MIYRNPKILALARDMPCMARLWCCNHNPETVVMAHSNASADGKGLGLKAHDFMVAATCNACHAAIDGRMPWRDDKLTAREAWEQAYRRTWLYLWQNGLVRVA